MMRAEVNIEAWRVRLQARKDAIEEKKLELELAPEEEKAELKRAMLQWMRDNPSPAQPSGLTTE